MDIIPFLGQLGEGGERRRGRREGGEKEREERKRGREVRGGSGKGCMEGGKERDVGR